jgi:hypothetical protein
VSGQRHAPAALLPPGKGPPVPIGQEAGGGGRAGLDTEARGKILCPCRGSNPKKKNFVEPYIDILVFFTTDDGQHVGRNAFGL